MTTRQRHVGNGHHVAVIAPDRSVGAMERKCASCGRTGQRDQDGPRLTVWHPRILPRLVKRRIPASEMRLTNRIGRHLADRQPAEMGAKKSPQAASAYGTLLASIR